MPCSLMELYRVQPLNKAKPSKVQILNEGDA